MKKIKEMTGIRQHLCIFGVGAVVIAIGAVLFGAMLSVPILVDIVIYSVAAVIIAAICYGAGLSVLRIDPDIGD